MRWTTRRVSHSGQLDRTVADGSGVGSVAGSHMECGYSRIRLASSRKFRLRHLTERRASLVEVVDLSPRIRNRRIGTGPREADFERGKQNAIDDDRFLIRAPDPGMPQTLSGLEGLNLKAVIVHCRDSKFFSTSSFRQVLYRQVSFRKRVFSGAEGTTSPPKPM
jgi:hypothetical protein